MRTHVKDALSTVLVALVLAGAVSAGMAFRAFGVPDVTILGFPFHYFWFVVGGWGTLFVVFAGYNRYAARLDAEKAQLRERYDRERSPAAGADPECDESVPVED